MAPASTASVCVPCRIYFSDEEVRREEAHEKRLEAKKCKNEDYDEDW